MRPLISLAVAVLLSLAGCASRPGPNDPARSQQTVTLVNSLTWTNAMSGKPDGLRSAWPLAELERHTERFPLAQVKRCDEALGTCSWGVLRAQRTLGKPAYVPGGVALELEVMVDVDRTQEVRRPEQNVAMTIPADVSALRARRDVKQALVLEYGKVHHIDFDFGIGFDVCLLRLDAARQPVDKCEIPYL